MTALRRSTAIAILLATLICGVISQKVDSWATCRQEVSQSNPVSVEVCRPLNLTDPPIALGLALGLILLLPDLRRLSIAGVVELETKVNEQAARQDTLERQLHLLMMSQRQSQDNRVQFFAPPLPESADVAATVENLESRAEAYLRDEGGDPTQEPLTPSD